MPLALSNSNVDTRMPHELMNSTPLKLKTANTVEDFAKALRAKSRLGHLIQTPHPTPAEQVATISLAEEPSS